MTSRVAVVAFPRLEDADRQWIEMVRERHDPQSGSIEAHFTLVFPIDAPAEEVRSSVRAAAAVSSAFEVVLTECRAVPDAVGSGGHVFLVPEEGREQVAKLHAQLYGGALAWAHRADIPYVPHMTVGADADVDRCEALARRLNRAPRSIRGRVETLTIVEVADGKVTRLAVEPLRATATAPSASGR